MKKALVLTALVIALSACSSTKTKQTNEIHEQAIGSIVVTYDKDDWIKITSTGTSPVYGNTPQAASEAAKIAAMHAKANIVEFMNNTVSYSSDIKNVSKSKSQKNNVNEDSDANITVSADVVEHLKSDARSVLRGIQISKETVDDETASVDVTVSKQSISAAKSLHDLMN